MLGESHTGVIYMREIIIALIGVILTIFGFIIGMGAFWYAKQQADKLADIHKTEMISLWAHIDRVHTLLIQIEEIAEDEKFIESGSLKRILIYFYLCTLP
jgi:hypothetical protein